MSFLRWFANARVPKLKEEEYLAKCTYCGGTKFHEGPSGGMSTNIRCANNDCRHWFNWTPELNQLDDLKRIEPTPDEEAQKRAEWKAEADAQRVERYNEGRQFYQDHLSALGLLSTAAYGGYAEARANIERLCGFLDMISDDIRTIQEMSAKTVHVVETGEDPIHVLGEPVPLGEMRRPSYGPGSITDAASYCREPDCKEPHEPGEKCAICPMRTIGRELLPFLPARRRQYRYAPGMDAAQEAERRIKEKRTQGHEFRMAHDGQYRDGWNAAIDHILAISGKWMYHTGTDEPPYHRPRLGEEQRIELRSLQKRE